MLEFPLFELGLVSLQTASSDGFLLRDGSPTVLSGDLRELGTNMRVGLELD